MNLNLLVLPILGALASSPFLSWLFSSI
jgi:hypothetical protein